MIYLIVLQNPAVQKAKGGSFCHTDKHSGTGMETGCSSRTQPGTGGSTWLGLGVPETTPRPSITSDLSKKIDGKPFPCILCKLPIHIPAVAHCMSKL